MARLELFYLGAFEVLLDGKPVTGFESSKVRALLAYLGIEHDRPHSREKLAGLFWPEQSEETAKKNLRQALSNLRKNLDETTNPNPVLIVTPDSIQIHSGEMVWSDTATFSENMVCCEAHRHRYLETCQPCIRRLQEMVVLYRGDFLQGFFIDGCLEFEDWLLILRERLHQQVLVVQHTLARHHEQRGEITQALYYARRQVELDPWREEAHQQFIRLFAMNGQRSAALRQYDICRKVLAEELGVEPAPETTELYLAVRRGEIEKLASLTAGKARRSNLPVLTTSFVGREDELAHLDEILADPNTRLLTLIGPGGIGKTRLALEAADNQIFTFKDGVFFVSLVGVATPEFIKPAIAESLGMPTGGTLDLTAQLINFLREKELLLVLDNFEHLLPGAEMLSDMLKNAPGIVIIVTARESLNLQAEQRYEVSGLRYPAEGEVSESRALLYAGIKLFVERARRIQRDFQPDAAALPWLVQICRLVEGMPLALELAATWILNFTLEQIVNEISRSLEFLAAPMRDLPPRHRSVWAAFEHSWQQLSPQEAAIFCKCSAFRDSFSLSAAQAVSGANLQILVALTEKSLIRQTAPDRYEMHELLRQFGEEKLNTGPDAFATHLAYACYYAGKLDELSLSLKSAGRSQALAELTVESENLLHAWRWVAQIETVPERDSLLESMLDSLYQFFEAHGLWQSGIEILTLALPNAGQNRAALLTYLGLLHSRMQQLDQAKPLLDEALELAQEASDEDELALIYFALSTLEYFSDRLEQAVEMGLMALQYHPDPYLAAQVWNRLGTTHNLMGLPDQARASYETALSLWQQVGIPAGIADTLSNLGEYLVDMGDYNKANQLLRQSVSLCREDDDRPRLGYSLSRLGYGLSMEQSFAEAEACYQESLEIFREMGHRGNMAVLYIRLGNLCNDPVDYPKAQKYYEMAIYLLREIGNVSTLAAALANLGATVFLLGDHDRAQALLQESLGLLRPTGRLWSIAHALISLGHVYLAKNDEKQSLVCFQEGIPMALQAQAGPLYVDAAMGVAVLLIKRYRCPRSLIELALADPACTPNWKIQGESLLNHMVGIINRPLFSTLEDALRYALETLI